MKIARSSYNGRLLQRIADNAEQGNLLYAGQHWEVPTIAAACRAAMAGDLSGLRGLQNPGAGRRHQQIGIHAVRMGDVEDFYATHLLRVL